MLEDYAASDILDKICEVCGKQAHYAVQDLSQHDDLTTRCRVSKGEGFHFYCPDHTRESHVYYEGAWFDDERY